MVEQMTDASKAQGILQRRLRGAMQGNVMARRAVFCQAHYMLPNELERMLDSSFAAPISLEGACLVAVESGVWRAGLEGGWDESSTLLALISLSTPLCFIVSACTDRRRRYTSRANNISTPSTAV